ncbi:MAG: HupE/UreJ family protein [Pseudomonadota bacterium]
MTRPGAAAIPRLFLFAILAVVLSGGVGPAARAHVTELAVISLHALDEQRWTMTWEMRPSTDYGASLQPLFPEHCVLEGPVLDCGETGLVGALGFEGIGAGQSAAMFKLHDLDGGTRVFTLTPAEPTALVRPSFSAESWAGLLRVGYAYLQIGIEHILLGVDHLLFVLGLVWIARGGWQLFKTITAFTLAHTVTLGAVAFGHLGVSERYVNALIALSIVFVGIEIIKAHRGEATLTLRYPWAVSFLFGLLHGLGFATALVGLGLPESAVPMALLAFNLGVELGQIAFVLAVLMLGWAYHVMRVSWPSWSRLVPAYGIGAIGAFWFFDRVAVLMGA